jgi:polygalacturonase
MRLWDYGVAIAACCLLAAGILAAAPQGGISIAEYGARGDGKEFSTQAIDRALKAGGESGGGTVLVPAGTFLTGPIKLPSHVTLHLAPGAVLQGSSNLADYRIGNARFPLVYAEKAEDIAIVGPGVIDGSGTSFMYMTKTRAGPNRPRDLDPNFTRQGRDYMDPKFGEADGPVVYLARPNRLIRLTECKNVLLRDVTLRNAPTWTLHLEDCEDVDVTGIRIANNLLVPK